MTQIDEKKRTYSQIPHKIRLELIELIQKENYPLSVAGELLGIKLSTAKLIMSKFKSKGYITKYKKQKADELAKRKRKEKKSLNKNQLQPIENHTKISEAEKQISKNSQKESIQQVITLQDRNLGIFPLIQYQIPVYFAWPYAQ